MMLTCLVVLVYGIIGAAFFGARYGMSMIVIAWITGTILAGIGGWMSDS